jgi:hypothetical protein
MQQVRSDIAYLLGKKRSHNFGEPDQSCGFGNECNLNTIKELIGKLQKLNNDLGAECFLGGAYVIEDPGNSVLNFLLNNNECGDINRDRGTRCAISHATFLNTKRFQTKNTAGVYSIDDNNPLLIVKKVGKTFRSMYEKVIRKNLYLECQGIKKHPGVLLFYPFTLIDNNTQEPSEYLYLKLETSRCFGAAHVKDFIHAKQTKLKKKMGKGPTSGKDNLISRREDENYISQMREGDERVYGSLGQEVLDKVNNYNTNIRVGAEFFIPSELWNNL